MFLSTPVRSVNTALQLWKYNQARQKRILCHRANNGRKHVTDVGQVGHMWDKNAFNLLAIFVIPKTEWDCGGGQSPPTEEIDDLGSCAQMTGGSYWAWEPNSHCDFSTSVGSESLDHVSQHWGIASVLHEIKLTLWRLADRKLQSVFWLLASLQINHLGANNSLCCMMSYFKYFTPQGCIFKNNTDDFKGGSEEVFIKPWQRVFIFCSPPVEYGE